MAKALNHTVEARMNSDTQMIVLGIAAVVGIIILFAQVKLFSIASTLTESKGKLNAISSTMDAVLQEMQKEHGKKA
jgi:hypothetical protein